MAGQLICVKNSGDLRGIFKNSINSIVVENEDSAQQICEQILENITKKDINLFGKRIQDDVREIIEDWDIRIEKELKLII